MSLDPDSRSGASPNRTAASGHLFAGSFLVTSQLTGFHLAHCTIILYKHYWIDIRTLRQISSKLSSFMGPFRSISISTATPTLLFDQAAKVKRVKALQTDTIIAAEDTSVLWLLAESPS